MTFQTICSAMRPHEVRTDEDYLRVLRRRRRIYIGMLFLGIVTFFAAEFAVVLKWNIALETFHLGFYSGVGTGMAFGAAVLLLRNHKAMKDPKRLRTERIQYTDERVQEISRRAIAAAGYALLMAVYLVCLIGGMFYPELLMLMAGLAGVFLLTYVISFFVYNKIM